MSDAQIGIGSKVELQRVTPNTWVQILEPMDITLPSSETEEIDVTSMSSPNRSREFIAGLTTWGDMSFDMNWKPSSNTDVFITSVKASGEPLQIRLTIASPTAANANATFVETYSGFCKGYERNAPVGEQLTATVTFKINGKSA